MSKYFAWSLYLITPALIYVLAGSLWAIPLGLGLAFANQLSGFAVAQTPQRLML